MDHQPKEPSRKEIAEFFRLGLIARLCKPDDIVQWAEKIIAADDLPHIVFIELSLAEGCPAEKFLTLLAEVPGEAGSYPVEMLLGQASRMFSSGRIDSQTLIMNLYRSSKVVDFPDHVEHSLVGFEDDVSLINDGVYGTIDELESSLKEFLSEWKYCAPAIEKTNGLARQD